MSVAVDNFLDDMVPRAAGLLAAFVVTWAAQHWGVTLDVKEVTGLFVSVYAIVHRALAAKRDALRSARRRTLRPEQFGARRDT